MPFLIKGGILLDKIILHKLISLVIFVLLLFLTIITTQASLNFRESLVENYDNTLYVGGDGPGNYSNIQDAIDDASNGDTIFVFKGIYHENVVVDKQLKIMGENKDDTVIDGGYGDYDVEIISDYVNFSGFSVTDCTGYYDAGIMIFSNFNDVSNNIVTNNRDGIRCEGSYNRLFKNFIFDNFNGIYLVEASYNDIVRNTVEQTLRTGVNVEQSSNFNNFIENTITQANWYGIGFGESSNNNTIFHNNFILNRWHAYDECINSWDIGYGNSIQNHSLYCGNFWDDYTGVDECAGQNQNMGGSDGNGDEPYYIEGNGNYDRYPFMFPYIPYPKLEIEFIPQGFQICALIKNVGSIDAVNVSWSMSLEGGFLFLPRNHNVNGSISFLLAGDEEIVCINGFIFGFGLIIFYVEAYAENADRANGEFSFFLFGPFIFVLDVAN